MKQVHWKQSFFYCRIHIETYPLLPCLTYTLTCKPEPSDSQCFLCCPSYPQPPAFHANLSRDLFEILGTGWRCEDTSNFKNHGPYSVLGVDSGLDWGISEIHKGSGPPLVSLKVVQCGEPDTHIMEYLFLRFNSGSFQSAFWSLPCLSEALFNNRHVNLCWVYKCKNLNLYVQKAYHDAQQVLLSGWMSPLPHESGGHVSIPGRATWSIMFESTYIRSEISEMEKSKGLLAIVFTLVDS